MNLHAVSGPRRPAAIAADTFTGSAYRGSRRIDDRANLELRDALIILADQMHEALARRRISERGTEQFQRADERVACVLELFGEMQRCGVVPDEVWRLPLRPLA